MLSEKWQRIVAVTEYAFQPIVNTTTGEAFGYEALLRGVKEHTPFDSIAQLFDAAFEDQVLYHLELLLRQKAITKFAATGLLEKGKLFLNVDNRILSMGDYQLGNTRALLKRLNINPSSLCFEVSESQNDRLSNTNFVEIKTILQIYNDQDFYIAIDDFGTGFSGFKFLYHTTPKFLKINRFFIESLFLDPRKRLFLSNIINIAHTLGVRVIAEGVETKAEFMACKDIGCELAQGYFIQHPTPLTTDLKTHYDHVDQLIASDRRDRQSDERLITSQIDRIEPIEVDEAMEVVFDRLRNNKAHNFLPVIDIAGQPLGIIKESDLKEYVYSSYGKELLINRSAGQNLRRFTTACATVELRSRAEHILEIFSRNDQSEGIIITHNMRYVGFLSAASLLKVIHEKNLAYARSQNPLSQLPGNSVISEQIATALTRRVDQPVLVYFDFDFFKPYNDKYGFRQGDRVILLFAEILRKELQSEGWFVGHIGGDDFFATIEGLAYEAVHQRVAEVIEKFRLDVMSFYDAADRQQGYILSKSREGDERRFNLLTVSAALLQIDARSEHLSTEEISDTIALLKKSAKSDQHHIAAAGTL
jgi:diguanylate cyclase (GGDEF)-like protein